MILVKKPFLSLICSFSSSSLVPYLQVGDELSLIRQVRAKGSLVSGQEERSR